tara:strand:+ start:614 stop:889 length:276 start_codon:yes stop_codon:yes gene_type:complete
VKILVFRKVKILHVWASLGPSKKSYHWFFFDGTFLDKLKNLKKNQNPQVFIFGKKSTIEKKPMVRSFRDALKVPKMHFFHFSEDQNFDSPE